MKTIQLETLDDHLPLKDGLGNEVFDKEGILREAPPFSFRENLIAVLGAPMAEGLKLQRIRELDRVFRIVEATKENGILQLEDADYDVLMEHLNVMNFGGYNRYICRLVGALEAASEESGQESN